MPDTKKKLPFHLNIVLVILWVMFICRTLFVCFIFSLGWYFLLDSVLSHAVVFGVIMGVLFCIADSVVKGRKESRH